MPTYDYECTNCGHTFEMLQSITAKPKRMPEKPCDGCGERAKIRRLIGGGGAVLFKGSGFYETDYRSEGYKKAAKAEKDKQSGSSSGSKGSESSGKSKADGSSSKKAANSGVKKS